MSMKIFNIIFIIIFTFTHSAYGYDNVITLPKSDNSSSPKGVKGCPEKFPKKPVQVSPETMNRVMQEAQTNKNIVIKKRQIGEGDVQAIADITEASLDAKVNLSSGSGSSGDGAAILFAIIGVVIIIAWIPYVFKFLETLSDDEVEFCPWYKLQYKFKNIDVYGRGEDLSSVDRTATFHGVQLSIGSLNPEFNRLGFSAELGTHHIQDEFKNWNDQRTTNNYHGTYLMVGPSLFFGSPDSAVLTFDLMAGVSTNEDVSMIGDASMNLSFPLSVVDKKYTPTFNFGLGSSFLNIKDNEGISAKFDEYAIYLTGGFGIHF